MKVAIFPRWNRPDKADGGIRRVVEAMERHLPGFGVEVVTTAAEADVVSTHGATWLEHPYDRPVVNHNHGLYWSRYDWSAWGHVANKDVTEAMARAQFHTAPSHWVAGALRRGMLVYPEVVHHGVEADEWLPADDWRPYVLWNKARADAVSDPADLMRLAGMMPDVRFVSTIGSADNVEQVGTMPVEEMREFVRHAGLYLATARETFGIGTLEAMSCGVPVVGWDWGGQTEIVRHGETGFLAKPGDYEALAEGVRWAMENRASLGPNARQDVLDRWGWEARVGQYADVFRRARAWWEEPDVKVSVIVTAHNLARYLPDCLDSVAAQDFEDWECVVVDDASEDSPEEPFRAYGGDVRFRLVSSRDNLKLPGARNLGFEHARGRYVIFLDADDMLAEHALLTLSGELDKDRSIHVAYGHLDTVSEDGSDRKRNSWPFARYSWRGQMAHLNQLPYAAMMRREVMERTGGYRTRHWRAEDAPLWILASSFGFRVKKVTEAATLVYRWRSDSKSMGEPGDGDWTAWFPWRMGADSGREGARVMRQSGGAHPKPEAVPWSAQAEPPEGTRFWPVPDHTDPRVSVVVPVGPGHETYLVDALDSLRAQTFQDWEAIVVNATGKGWDPGFGHPCRGAPWANVVEPDPPRKLRPSEARNLGASRARADALLMLDADDILLPDTLEEMYAHHVGTGGGLVYTDWLKAEPDPREPMELTEAYDFVCGDVLNQMKHSMMCLIPRWAHDEVGGFDETLPGWEDWDYLIALQAAGVCSYRVPVPGFVYRFRTGTVREDSYGKKDAILKLIRDKWADYYERRKVMGCGGCPKKARASVNPSANPGNPHRFQRTQAQRAAASPQPAMVLLSYQGPGDGKVNVRGPITNMRYVFRRGQAKYVMAEDAEQFLGRTRKGVADFLLVEQRQEEPAPRLRVPVEVVPQPEGGPARPSFPKMPGPDARDPSDMTIAQLAEAALDADERVLLQWLQEERKGKSRKGAVKALEAALERHAEPEPA